MARKKTESVALTASDAVLITTSRGVQLECMPIAAEIEQQETNIRDSIDWPDVPRRSIEDVAGSTMKVELTQDYVDSEHATGEERAAWEQYRADLIGPNAEFTQRLNLARPRLIALRGVRLVDPSLMDDWSQDHTWLGMRVPDDPRERAYHFFMTEILGNLEEDMTAVMVGIYRASGYDSEVLDQVEASFRSALGKAKPATNTRDPGPQAET